VATKFISTLHSLTMSVIGRPIWGWKILRERNTWAASPCKPNAFYAGLIRVTLQNPLPRIVVDPYDRAARLFPGLLVVLPLSTLLICLYGSGHPWASTSVSVLGLSGVGYALGRASRDAGKRVQERLYKKWGGAPTTQLLRHRDTGLDRYTKERYHAVLSKMLGKQLPTVEAEMAAPDVADELYYAATALLISRTRDTKAFPLVFKENIAYGFQRNSYGIRWFGISTACVCMLWILVHAHVVFSAQQTFSADAIRSIRPPETLSLAISIAALTFWAMFPTEAAVKRTAFAYTERLLESCDKLTLPTRNRSDPRKGK
jgi:hypothetical protein